MVGVNVRNTKCVGDAGRTIFLQHHRPSIMQYAWLSDMWPNIWLTSTCITFNPLWSWKFEEYYITGCVRVQPWRHKQQVAPKRCEISTRR